MKKFNINTPNLADIIQQYLHGSLSKKETNEFERALAQDDVLKAEVEFFRWLQTSLKEKRRMETREMLQQITSSMEIEENPEQLKNLEEQLKHTSPKGPPGFSPLKIIGLSLGVLTSGILIWLFLPYTISSTDAQNIFQKYYSPFSLVESVDPQSQNPPDRALYEYSKANFPEVITLLEEYPNYTTEMDLLMALGISYIETQAIPKAEKIFTIISKDTLDIYAKDAQWYLALVMLKQHKVTTARTYLEGLQHHEKYGNKVEVVLKEIPVNRFSKYTK